MKNNEYENNLPSTSKDNLKVLYLRKLCKR